MKILMVITCLWVASLIVLQSPNDKGTTKQNGTPGANPSTKAAQTKNEASSALPGGTVVNCNQEIESASHDCHAGQSDEDVKIQRQLAKFTKYLVWVGALQFVALLIQATFFFIHSRHLGALAKAASNNAIAATGSAEALINSERPWVTATIRKIAVEGLYPVTKDGATVATSGHFIHNLVLTNIGKTPAEIRAVRGDPHITNKGIDGGYSNGDDPKIAYGLPVEYRQVRLLAPNQEWVLRDVELSMSPYSPREIEQLDSGALHIFFAGLVVYRDTFRPDIEHEHKTAFCYTYLPLPDEWAVSGPGRFTEYT